VNLLWWRRSSGQHEIALYRVAAVLLQQMTIAAVNARVIHKNNWEINNSVKICYSASSVFSALIPLLHNSMGLLPVKHSVATVSKDSKFNSKDLRELLGPSLLQKNRLIKLKKNESTSSSSNFAARTCGDWHIDPRDFQTALKAHFLAMQLTHIGYFVL